MEKRCMLSLIACLAAGNCLLLAQAIPSSSPQFEVASIKASEPGTQTTLYRYPGGRFAASKATLKTLVKFAYEVSDRRITGGPDWLDSARFDIAATPERGMGTEQSTKDRNIRLMLQALLADRFQLKVDHDIRQLPIYGMTVAKGGPKLQPNSEKPFGITRRQVPGGEKTGGRKFTFTKISMAQLASALSGDIGGEDVERTVVDKTGLEGDFDFTLTWFGDLAPRQVSSTTIPGMDATADGPSIFSAMVNQLGLRLQPENGAVDVLRISRAQRPSAN
jgi:uncharacterized protein (TIGR03435 family)